MGNIRLATVTILSQMSSIGKLKCPFDLINFLWLEVMKFLGEVGPNRCRLDCSSNEAITL